METAMRANRILDDLATLASKNGHEYEVIPYAFGFMLCKDGKNLTSEIGEGLITISRYLLDVIEGSR